MMIEDWHVSLRQPGGKLFSRKVIVHVCEHRGVAALLERRLHRVFAVARWPGQGRALVISALKFLNLYLHIAIKFKRSCTSWRHRRDGKQHLHGHLCTTDLSKCLHCRLTFQRTCIDGLFAPLPPRRWRWRRQRRRLQRCAAGCKKRWQSRRMRTGLRHSRRRKRWPALSLPARHLQVSKNLLSNPLGSRSCLHKVFSTKTAAAGGRGLQF